MESKVNKISDIINELEVTLSYDEIKDDIDAAYKKERKNISLPGFRKGKVPMNMLKKLYGEAIEYKACEDIANKKFWEVVESEELKLISTPQLSDIDFVPGDKLSFKVRYEVKPVFEVKDFKNLEVKKPVFKVKDELILQELDKLVKQHASFEPAEEVTDSNYKIKVVMRSTDAEGNIKEDVEPYETELDLSNASLSKELVDGAIGEKVGDTFTYSFTDEHKHGEEVHKEEYHYTVEILEINKIILPETDEEFCKKISGDKAKSLVELKELIRKNYTESNEKESEEIYTNAILSKIVENNDFELPQGYTEKILERLVDGELERAKQQGYKNIDRNMLKENLKARAEWFAKWQIISENLAEQEGIKITDADLEKLAQEEAEKIGISKEKLINFYKSSKRDESLLEEKIISFLKENNPPTLIDGDEFEKEEKEKSEDKQ